MDYDAINLENSFECFKFIARNVIQNLKGKKKESLFLENRKTSKSDVIIFTKQNKAKGVQEQVELLADICPTIMMTQSNYD